MRCLLIGVALLVSGRLSAQLSVGSQGMTILAGTPVSADGLTFIPSTNFTLVNNTIQRSSTPLAGNPGINRLYQFSSPILFSGQVGLFYQPSELNGYTEASLQLAYTSANNGLLTITTGSSVNTSTHYVSNSVTSQNLLVVTASALPDLTPVLYARPSSTYNTKPISVVVEVYELNGAPTHGPIVVKLNKDPKTSLSFSPRASSVGGISVQNGAWSFDSDSDEDYYILTSTQAIAAGDVLAFGLTGNLSPGATSGSLTFTGVLGPGSGGEVLITNNSDADKIDFFQQ